MRATASRTNNYQFRNQDTKALRLKYLRGLPNVTLMLQNGYSHADSAQLQDIYGENMILASEDFGASSKPLQDSSTDAMDTNGTNFTRSTSDSCTLSLIASAVLVATDFDDSQQELSITALDAVDAYARKTGLEFDEFFSTREFDKYIKTCLWNKKNNLGNKIKKKYHIRSYVSISENPDISTGSGIPTQVPLEVDGLTVSADDAPLTPCQTGCRSCRTRHAYHQA